MFKEIYWWYWRKAVWYTAAKCYYVRN